MENTLSTLVMGLSWLAKPKGFRCSFASFFNEENHILYLFYVGL